MILAGIEKYRAQTRATYLTETRVDGSDQVGEIEAAELRLTGKSEISIAMSAFQVMCRRSRSDSTVANSQVAEARVFESPGI